MATNRRRTSSSTDNSPAERFADYFVICGLDEEDGLEPHQSADGDATLLTPLQLPYKASILWHYPENEPDNPFEADGIRLLCMPRGAYFRKSMKQKKQRFHSFLQTRENGTKIYGFVLTFYEKIKNENIIMAMDTLFRMFDTEESLLESPGKSASAAVTPERKSRTRLNRTRSYYSYSREQEDLYVSKCICLVMKKAYVTVARKCLESILHVALHEEESHLNIESYIYNVLYEIPSPPSGRNMKYVSLDDQSVIVLNPNQNELPYFDYSMIEVLMTLGFENLVDLFTCMLLEHQILFLSSDIHKLMLIAECLTILFFPLYWQHVYVPVLPPSLLHFLDAPVPFIMGLYYETEEEKNTFELPFEGALCLLDIDNNEIQLPQEIPELPGRNELIEELKNMAHKYGIKPPQGISRLRRSGSVDGAENILYLDLSHSHSEEDPDSSMNSSFEYSTSTWPRKKHVSIQQTVISQMENRNKMAATNSPSMSRKVLSTSNWAGESTPHIHEDSSNTQAEQGDIQEKSPQSEIQEPLESPQTLNPRLAAMMALAEKAGLNTTGILKKRESSQTTLDSSSEQVNKKDEPFVLSARAMTVSRKQQHENEFNIVVREIFVNCFTQMLVDYEHFVILPQQTKDDWLNNREHMQNFDKASFLSDQSQTNLPFMTLFVETQGFASLIDMKIMALWEDCDPRLTYFDKRIDKLKVKLGIIRSPVYERCTSIPSAVENYVKACSHVDHSAAQPHTLKITIQREKALGYFPMPEKLALIETKRKKSGRINWRKRDKQKLQNDHILLNEALKVSHAEGQKIKEKLAERVKKYMQESKMITKDTANTPGGAAQKTLSAFADKLLKECKIKTKRLVVLKLGQEAVELGHAGPNTVAIEENTLIASLCDLLERVWSHGVQFRQLEFGKESAKSRFVQRMRQSKSALWSHLLAFYHKESERLAEMYGVTDVENVADEVKKLIIEANIQQQQHQQSLRKQSAVDVFAENLARAIRTRSPEPVDRRSDYDFIAYDQVTSSSLPTTPTMPNMESRRQQELLARIDFLNNLKTVLEMKEIKTDTGYARAWTRLALEKKVLTKDLKILLNNKKILKSRYKDYAFIRTEDEMEQFLYHLLSLNAVDFYCFTNGFSSTMTTYKVHIVLGKQMGSATSANSWIDITGSLASTGTINAPKGAVEFRFMHKNLGILSALRIGHDNTGISPGWFIEYVAVINELTGMLYKFQCGRWLAKGQDDGSTERLLIAEILNHKRVTGRRPMEALRLGISDKPPSQPSSVGGRRMSLFTKKYVKYAREDAYSNTAWKVMLSFNDFINQPGEIWSFTPDFSSSLCIEENEYVWRSLKLKFLEILQCLDSVTSGDIQEKVADSVNNIVKYFYKDSNENLTYLLCGEGGFCEALENVFQYGFKATRLFGKKLFVWDFIEKVHEDFVEACSGTLTNTQLRLRSSFCTTVQTINTSSVALSVGKQQKFQLFTCLGLRDQNLQNWFKLLRESPITSQMYESNSFFRDGSLLSFLLEVLEALAGFDVQLDKTITRGI